MTDETQTWPKDLGMVCSCAPADKEKAQALVDEVARRLKTDPAHYLTAVAWSLRTKHRVSKWDVVTDARFAIRAKTYSGDSVVIACDELERPVLQEPIPGSTRLSSWGEGLDVLKLVRSTARTLGDSGVRAPSFQTPDDDVLVEPTRRTGTRC